MRKIVKTIVMIMGISLIFVLLQVLPFSKAINILKIREVEAATTATADDAINWVKSQLNNALDYDGVYGAQCVDLIKYYYAYLGVSPVSGNAVDYTNNSLPSGYAYKVQRLKKVIY